jgi:hypothetical protein
MPTFYISTWHGAALTPTWVELLPACVFQSSLLDGQSEVLNFLAEDDVGTESLFNVCKRLDTVLVSASTSILTLKNLLKPDGRFTVCLAKQG